jgi:hypothetical protein
MVFEGALLDGFVDWADETRRGLEKAFTQNRRGHEQNRLVEAEAIYFHHELDRKSVEWSPAEVEKRRDKKPGMIANVTCRIRESAMLCRLIPSNDNNQVFRASV